MTTRLRLRFSLWQNGLPADALPLEGWMELPLLHREDLTTHSVQRKLGRAPKGLTPNA